MDFRRLAPSMVRHPNRREPAERIRNRCDVIPHDDGRITLAYLTESELTRIHRLAQRDVHLFPLCYAIEAVLGINQEQTA